MNKTTNKKRSGYHLKRKRLVKLKIGDILTIKENSITVRDILPLYEKDLFSDKVLLIYHISKTPHKKDHHYFVRLKNPKNYSIHKGDSPKPQFVLQEL